MKPEDDFKYSRLENNESHNNRCYPLCNRQPPYIYDTVLWYRFDYKCNIQISLFKSSILFSLSSFSDDTSEWWGRFYDNQDQWSVKI